MVLTARDEQRGLDAVEKLKAFGLSPLVIFHLLDVGSSESVAAAADLVKTEFGKLGKLPIPASLTCFFISYIKTCNLS